MVAVDDRALQFATDYLPFAISVRLDGDLAVAVVCGDLDMATAPYIRQNLEPFRARVKSAAFDLVDMTFLDLTGLGSLRYAINDDGTGVSIRTPSRVVRRLLEFVGLEALIERDPLASAPRRLLSSPLTTIKEYL